MPKKDQKPSNTYLRHSKEVKLIPRDISESLGKLPPQALDLESEVLGAILLEHRAYDRIKHFLRAEHFYSEQHSVLFQAIVTLRSEDKLSDMKSVRAQLSKTGHIDIVGGAFFLAELTSNVSSSASIEQHARIIVEHSVKRSLIQIASQVHHDAYEDTTDAFELLEKFQETIKFVEENTVAESNETKIKALWEQLLVKEKPPEDEVLLKIQGIPCVIANNYINIVGKKKSRKTFFLVWLLAQGIHEKTIAPDEILMFDTEQGRSDVWLLREAIFRMTGHYIPIFYLRGMSPADRRDFIQGTVKHWPKHPKLAIIDGIRDCMININDPEESTEVIVWLEQLTLQHNLAMINILHLNKSDNNARGHIGTELLNKGWMTILIELDEKQMCSIAKCDNSRKKPFVDFAFTHGADDLPQIVGVPTKGDATLPNDERKNRLIAVFDDEPALSYKDLCAGIRKHFSNSKGKAVGINRSQNMVTEFIREGWIVKSGKEKDPTTVYKLMVSAEPPPNFVPVASLQITAPQSNGHHEEQPVVVVENTPVVTENVPVNTTDLTAEENDLPF